MSSPLKQTPLHAVHVESGARMVDFGGWHMPLAYGSQLNEHHAVRQDAGMFDVSHMLAVDIQGADARAFLRMLLANDVNKIKASGKALYSCMLNGQGGVIDDLITYFFSDTDWRTVVNAGTAQGDLAWMQQVARDHAFQVDITARHDLAMLAVQGPNACERVWSARPQWREAGQALSPFSAVRLGDALVARTGYTGEDGLEIMLLADQVIDLWKELVAQGVQPCGLGARDTLRLEAGMNLYGQDMNDQVTPWVSGLGWTLSLADADRHFMGRAALEAAPRDQILVGVRLLERGVMRAHMAVRTAHGDGELTSGTMSPTLGYSIGMARVPAGVQPGDAIQIDIRGKWVPAEVVKMPFVRNGKALV